MNRFYRINFSDRYPLTGQIRAEGSLVLSANSEKEAIGNVDTMFPILRLVSKFTEEIKKPERRFFDITMYLEGFHPLHVEFYPVEKYLLHLNRYKDSVVIKFPAHSWELNIKNPVLSDHDIDSISKSCGVRPVELKKFFEGFLEWQGLYYANLS